MNVFELYASLDLDAASYYNELNQARNTAVNEGTNIQNILRQSIGDMPAPDTTDYEHGLNQAESESESFINNVNGFFAKLGIVAALTAAGKALTDFAENVVSAYSTFEQMEGGVDTIFGAGGDTIEQYAERVGKSVAQVESEYQNLIDAQELVKDNAKNAFASAGISANEYMNTITGFSSALIQSLGGDTKEAAEVADRALRDMSDNANKFGNDMATVSATYQSLARGSYMMLDNLKLGYGGTKAEMERLIADTAKMTDIQEKLNITVKEGDLSFGNIVNAISVLQDKLNIAGATAQEAAGTIEGSLNAMKAAWENLVTDLGSGTADIEQDVENLTEYFGYAVDNITPVVENMVAQVPTALEGVVEAAGDIIPTFAQTIIENAPNLLNSAFTMVSTLAQGIADNLPVLVPSAVEAVIDVADTLLDNVDMLVDAGFSLLEGLGEGLIQALPTLISRAPEIVTKLATEVIYLAPKMVASGIELIVQLFSGLLDPQTWTDSIDKLAEQFGSIKLEFTSLGHNLWDALISAWEAYYNRDFSKWKQYGADIYNQLNGGISTVSGGGLRSGSTLTTGIDQMADDIEESADNLYDTSVESGDKIDKAGSVLTAHANDYGKNAQLAYAAMFEGGYRSMDSSLKHYAEGLDKMLATHKITQDEYDRKLSAYLNNNVDKNSELWWKYYDGIEKRKEQAQAQALKESEKAQKEADKEAKKSADNVKGTITAVGSTILNAFSTMSTTIGTSITDKVKTLASVIGVAWSGLGTSIKKTMEDHTKEIEADAKTYTNTLQGIWDGYVEQLDLWKKIDISDTLTAWQIGDIDRQTAGLQRYEDTYKAVLGRMGDEIDDTEKNLLKKISGMSLEDKTSFTDYLAGMTESEFNAYMQSYKKYVEQAGELATIEGNSISDINEEIAKSLISDVDYEGIGKTGAEQYLSGFYEGIKNFTVDVGAVGASTAEISQVVPVKSTPAQTTPENITVNINGIQFKTVDELTQALVQAITNTTNRRKAGYAV